jgi:hypothetical protein
MKTKVMYEGIDSWNRPVFRELREKTGDTKPKNRYGSLDILFPYGESEEEVLKKVEAGHLCYFGNHFDCEPHGYDCNVEIVKEADVPRELM